MPRHKDVFFSGQYIGVGAVDDDKIVVYVLISAVIPIGDTCKWWSIDREASREENSLRDMQLHTTMLLQTEAFDTIQCDAEAETDNVSKEGDTRETNLLCWAAGKRNLEVPNSWSELWFLFYS